MVQRAEDVARAVMAEVSGPRCPASRLRRARSVLALEDEFRAIRRQAMAELRAEGWTWQEIGSIIGCGKDRAWQIGNGR